MARKTKKQSAISDQQSAAPDRDAQIGYTIGSWAGHTQYKCKQCEFDTLELDQMLEHLLAVHSVIAVDGPTPALIPGPSPEGRGEDVEKADGIFEIDLKEDQ